MRRGIHTIGTEIVNRFSRLRFSMVKSVSLSEKENVLSVCTRDVVVYYVLYY